VLRTSSIPPGENKNARSRRDLEFRAKSSSINVLHQPKDQTEAIPTVQVKTNEHLNMEINKMDGYINQTKLTAGGTSARVAIKSQIRPLEIISISVDRTPRAERIANTTPVSIGGVPFRTRYVHGSPDEASQ